MHEFSSQRETLTYRYGYIDTPFLKSSENEDRLLGAFTSSAYLWKILSIIGLSLSFLLLLLIAVKLVEPSNQVFYAEVLQNGFVKDSGTLMTQSEYEQTKL